MPSNILKANERLDDLERDGLYVIQNKTKYCFSIDSVLLSDFVKLNNADKALELCSGCGVISFLVNAKCHPKSICALELDSDLYDMSTRSLAYNKISNIEFINGDIKDYKSIFKGKKFDAIFTNPPYLKPLENMSRVSDKFHSTKYETTLSLQDVLQASRDLLREDGHFYIIYFAPRVQELLSKANSLGLYLKTMQNVFFKVGAPSALVMCEFVKKLCQADVIEPLIIN